MTDDPLLSIDEVATYLGISKHNLYRFNSTGTGPDYFKVGKHVRYRASEVERWLDDNKVGSAA